LKSFLIALALLIGGGLSAQEARTTNGIASNATNRLPLPVIATSPKRPAPFLRLTNAEGKVVVINTNLLTLGRDLPYIRRTLNITNEIPLSPAQREFLRTNEVKAGTPSK